MELVNGFMKPTVKTLKTLKKGDWLFTCNMKPLQFDSFDPEKKAENYNRASFTNEAWERFSKFDSFTTVEGSSHSVTNCSCRRISADYAKWFLENNIDSFFEQFKDEEDRWKLYEAAVKEKCDEAGIEFEGI